MSESARLLDNLRGAICGVGFVICLVLLILSRLKEEKQKKDS